MRTRMPLAVVLMTLLAAGAFHAQIANPIPAPVGVQIHYVDKGRGAPVVLIHGFTGSYARHWEAPGVIDALEKTGYRVIAMDCRGAWDDRKH